LVFSIFVFFAPNFFGEAINYSPANPLVTPPHIVPEWYFLPFYAILRSIPDKLGGVIAMFGAVAILFFLPWLDRAKTKSAAYRPMYRPLFWVFVLNCIVLGWIGAKPPEGWYLIVGRVATFYYFSHFLIVLPVIGWMERPLPLPQSISDYYTQKNKRQKK
jgi:ubiquinol-cytochrome c reductase cytochrome b subunit